jgi:hypothetical protein
MSNEVITPFHGDKDDENAEDFIKRRPGATSKRPFETGGLGENR